jgi:hypothetical protein
MDLCHKLHIPGVCASRCVDVCVPRDAFNDVCVPRGALTSMSRRSEIILTIACLPAAAGYCLLAECMVNLFYRMSLNLRETFDLCTYKV